MDTSSYIKIRKDVLKAACKDSISNIYKHRLNRLNEEYAEFVLNHRKSWFTKRIFDRHQYKDITLTEFTGIANLPSDIRRAIDVQEGSNSFCPISSIAWSLSCGASDMNRLQTLLSMCDTAEDYVWLSSSDYARTVM